MTENINIFYDTILSVPIVTFFVAVFLKWTILRIINGKFSLDKALWSWGMPSVHSAIVVSLATAIALKHWVSSDYFALAMTFTVIIIYDAINIRFEAGLHAWAINERLWEKKFKESLWHLPSEAFAWSILWIVVSTLLYFI